MIIYCIHQLIPQKQSSDITGLEPFQLVRVTVSATTGGGTGAPSNMSTGRTSEGGKVLIYTSIQKILKFKGE